MSSSSLDICACRRSARCWGDKTAFIHGIAEPGCTACTGMGANGAALAGPIPKARIPAAMKWEPWQCRPVVDVMDALRNVLLTMPLHDCGIVVRIANSFRQTVEFGLFGDQIPQECLLV